MLNAFGFGPFEVLAGSCWPFIESKPSLLSLKVRVFVGAQTYPSNPYRLFSVFLGGSWLARGFRNPVQVLSVGIITLNLNPKP